MKYSQCKICEVCNGDFFPDHRVSARQRVCEKLSCKQEFKHRNQQAWLKKNPGYFKGRYPELKEKILIRQQRLKAQKELSKTVERSVTIQDELTVNNNNILNLFNELITIQDEITPKIIIVNRQLQQMKVILYKTSEPTVFK